MKKLKKILALSLVLIMVLGATSFASAAAVGANGFGELPAGIFTYVSETPKATADSGAGEIQFIWESDTIKWAFGAEGAVKTGDETLSGDELEFFKGLYISDRPVTDWLGGNPKDIEGYAGYVADGVQITITKDAKISKIQITNPKTRALAILTEDITAPKLTIHGITRGQPNLLQSCLTIMGSTNGLYLTKQGDVILDGITIGHDETGLGLSGDKIGGDTFVVGTVEIDGTIEWHGLKGVITALGDRPGTLLTNGQDIHMTGGSNIGRVGRDLTISTGADKGGDIIIGDKVSCDATRGGLLPNADTSTDSLAIATSGDIIAGTGNVVIGTNTEKAVLIDMIGNIQGSTVTIKPIDWGKLGNISMCIGDITATGDIDIVVGNVNPGEARLNISQSSVGEIVSTGNTSVSMELPANPIGNLSSETGSISLTAAAVGGGIGSITAPGGVATVTVASADGIGDVSAASVKKSIDVLGADGKPTASSVVVNGSAVGFDAYNIKDNNYFKLRDLAYILSGTDNQFDVAWDEATNAIVLTSGKAYTAVGGEMQGKGTAEVLAVLTGSKVVLDGKEVNLTAYNIDGNNYFKLRDIGEALDFGVDWDSVTSTIVVDTEKAYTPAA